MRVRVFSRGAAWRLAVFVVLLGVASGWSYFAMVRMPGISYAGALEPLDAHAAAVRDQLQADVTMLASGIGDRSVPHPRGLHAAADRVEAVLAASGLSPKRQTFAVDGVHCDNVEAEIAGTDRPGDVVIVGAHYDSVVSTTGADDNASGTAAMLALARTFATRRPHATLRFVAFANEEPPYFQTANMGSVVYARRCKARGEHVVAMLSLETVGYYSDAKSSQKYPPLLSLLYPSTGNFIGFVGDRTSADLVRRTIGIFRSSTRFPSEGAALFASMPGVGWSDQWSFWQEGYPAIMVTDTAPFRYPHYHTRADTPDKPDYERMARVVGGLEHVVEDLVGGT
jgi:Zn-dependent M28 family amino/carboxypeptidase